MNVPVDFSDRLDIAWLFSGMDEDDAIESPFPVALS